MSNAKQCNRCGKYYEHIPKNLPGTKTGPKYSITYYKQLNALGGSVASVKSFDLCPECAQQLTYWAENPDSFVLRADKFDRVNAISPEETKKILKIARDERKMDLESLAVSSTIDSIISRAIEKIETDMKSHLEPVVEDDGHKDISTLKFDTDPNSKPFAYSLTKLTDMFATNPVEMAGILKDCRSIDVHIDGVLDDKYFLIEDLIDPNKSNAEISDYFKHKYPNIMNKEENSMEPKTMYFIQNVGCDDETSGLVYLSEDEFKFLMAIFYNLNKNSEYCCMPKIYMAKVQEDMFVPLLTSEEIDAVDEWNVFYDQFGNAFTWAEGYDDTKLKWIDYKLWLDDTNKEEK